MRLKYSYWLKLVGFAALFFVINFLLAFFLLEGLNKYYGLGDDSEIALVGHSHLMLGVDKKEMEIELGKKVSKYTREGVNVFDCKMMVQQLLSNNPQLKRVIYGVDAWTFSSEGLSRNSYKLFYPFMDDKTVNHYVYSSADIGDYLTKKLIPTTRYNEQLLGGAIRGYFGKWTNLKFGTVDLEVLRIAINKDNVRKIENIDENIEVFKQTLALLFENDIEVILLYVPTIDLMSEAQEDKFQETINLFEKISEDSEKVEFLNLQEPFSHNYELFYDAIHMNPKGQAEVTKELIAYLREQE